jgi:hypothetical protein
MEDIFKALPHLHIPLSPSELDVPSHAAMTKARPYCTPPGLQNAWLQDLRLFVMKLFHCRSVVLSHHRTEEHMSCSRSLPNMQARWLVIRRITLAYEHTNFAKSTPSSSHITVTFHHPLCFGSARIPVVARSLIPLHLSPQSRHIRARLITSQP